MKRTINFLVTLMFTCILTFGFLIKTANAQPRILLTYGTLYHIQNAYNQLRGGYLDTRNRGCSNALCVSTSSEKNRDSGSGLWVILSPENKPNGTPVSSEDTLYLQNQFYASKTDKSYLDTRNPGCNSNLLCVSTSYEKNRDNGSGLWKITRANPSGENKELYANDIVYIQNGFDRFRSGGFLDTRNPGCQGNLLCVSTSVQRERDNGSTIWKFIPAPF